MSVTLATDQPFGSLAREMGKFIDQIHKGYYGFQRGENWTPPVNLYETDGAYIVCVDLAGVEKEKIDITVDEHVLRLHGQRAVPNPGMCLEHFSASARPRMHLMEIDHGSFSREVELPENVVQDNIAAHYSDGLLWIELPKK